jgi:hypothetical protein
MINMSEGTTEIDTQPDNNSLSVFESAYELQLEVLDLDNKIKTLKKKIGLSALEKELKDKKDELQSICENLVSKGIYEEDTLRILDEGKSMRIVNPERLKEYSLTIYYLTMEFPVTKVEKAIAHILKSEGKDEDESLSKATEITNSLSDIDRRHKYSVVNLEVD